MWRSRLYRPGGRPCRRLREWPANRRLRVTPFVTTLGMLTFLRGLADQRRLWRIHRWPASGSVGLWPRILVRCSLRRLHRRNCAHSCMVVASAHANWPLHFRDRWKPRDGAGRWHSGHSTKSSPTPCAASSRALPELCSTSRVAIGQGAWLRIRTALYRHFGYRRRCYRRWRGQALRRRARRALADFSDYRATDIAGVNSFYQQMVTGVVLIVAVLIAQLQKR